MAKEFWFAVILRDFLVGADFICISIAIPEVVLVVFVVALVGGLTTGAAACGS